MSKIVYENLELRASVVDLNMHWFWFGRLDPDPGEQKRPIKKKNVKKFHEGQGIS